MAGETKLHHSCGERSVKRTELNKEDLEIADEFLNEYGTLQKLSIKSINKYRLAIWYFLRVIKQQGTKLSIINKPAILELINYVSQTTWAEDTREDFWKRWLKFCEWYSDHKSCEWGPEARTLLVDTKKRYRYKIDKNKVTKKGIFTPEEAIQLVHAEPNISWQVYWAVLYESGIRAGEAEALRLCDVKKLNGKGYALELPKSKTMKRTIPIVHFAKNYLSKWLQIHPKKEDPEAPLFVNVSGEPVQSPAANKRLKGLLKGLNWRRKKTSLHSFRHSRATELSHHLTEAQMCAFFGWTIGSDMPATYIRAEAVDVTNALMKAYGYEDKEAYEIKGRACLNCQHINPFSAENCDICSLPLDVGKAEAIKEAVKTKSILDGLKENLIEEVKQSFRAELLREIMKEFKGIGDNKQ